MDETIRPLYAAQYCETHHEVLESLGKLAETSYAKVLSALTAYSEKESNFNRPHLIEQIAVVSQDVMGFKPEDAQDLVDALIDLAVLNRIESRNDRDVIKAVVGQITRDSEELEGAALENRLRELMSDSTISSVAGVDDLYAENERVMIDTRIITDIRPVYESRGSHLEVVDMILMHKLKIRYWEDSEERTFYVTMRESDLSDLAKRIGREEEKADGLRGTRLVSPRAPGV